MLVDMSGFLDSAEVLASPNVQSSADLNITNLQLNTDVVEINGSSVAIGQAVMFTISSNVPGQYDIEIVCSTDAGQTVEGSLSLYVVLTKYQSCHLNEQIGSAYTRRSSGRKEESISYLDFLYASFTSKSILSRALLL